MGGLRLVDKWRRLGGVSIVNTIPGDCTAGVQAAINATPCGGTLYFPAGTYTISASAPGTYSILSLNCGIKIEGDGVGETIIKIANACPTYHWLLGPDTAGTDLTGLEIQDLTFDHNIANNAITNEAEILAWPEYSCGTYTGSDISIHDLEVINASSTNNIVVNGICPTMTNITIENITCSAIGDDPNHIVHDACLIYVHASGISVSGCDLGAVAPVSSVGAIEVHGTDYTVENNTAQYFTQAFNICGISEVVAEDCIVRNNTITDCKVGIQIYSEVHAGGPGSGNGIDGLEIYNNSINIIPFGGVGDIGIANRRVGISFYGGCDLDINDLNIHDNDITLDTYESSEGGFELGSTVGIGGGSYPNIMLSNSLIEDNTITNFPNSGIALFCNLDTISIKRNVLINCGSSMSPAISDPYRTPISIEAFDLIDTVDISDNTFIDNIPVTRIPYFVYLRSYTSSPGLVLDGNTYTITGDKVVFVQHIYLYDDNVVPLITETIANFVGPTHKVVNTSTVIDGIYTWTVDATGLVWSKCRTGDTLLTVYPNAHPETVSVDGFVQRNTAGTWAQIIAGAGTWATDDSDIEDGIGGRGTANANEFTRCWRTVLLFDTSSLPGGAVVDEAALKISIHSKSNNLGWTNAQAGMALVAAVPTTGNTVLVAADYGAFGAVRLATDIPYNNVTAGTYAAFQLNASGIAAVVDGVSKFGIRIAADLDASAVAWVSGAETSIFFRFADNVTNIPKLEVQYHVP